MNQSISPINITAAALITQFSIILILFIGAIILNKWEGFVPFYAMKQDFSKFAWIILALALITIGCLVFSDEFSTTWTPLFGSLSFHAISWSTAILIMFVMNIICVTIMVSHTGGSRFSPFIPIYFMLPALAIFLREPLSRIILHLIFISIVFTWNFSQNKDVDSNSSAPSFAYWFISIACFVLSTFIGYVTRIQ